jgi:hypothetical protein
MAIEGTEIDLTEGAIFRRVNDINHMNIDTVEFLDITYHWSDMIHSHNRSMLNLSIDPWDNPYEYEDILNDPNNDYGFNIYHCEDGIFTTGIASDRKKFKYYFAELLCDVCPCCGKKLKFFDVYNNYYMCEDCYQQNGNEQNEFERFLDNLNVIDRFLEM